LEIDHIIPEARGGTSVEENLWLPCPMCNSHKADRQEALDPESRAMVALFNPRAERWEEHFESIEAGTIIQGKTPQGRATVMALQMNHPDILAARRLWAISGWHPPED
jgi:HNH endonuclease